MIFRVAITYSRLVIVDDLDVKGVTVTPSETDPPLLVDPYAVLASRSPFKASIWFEPGIERSFRSPAAFSCCSFISARS